MKFLRLGTVIVLFLFFLFGCAGMSNLASLGVNQKGHSFQFGPHTYRIPLALDLNEFRGKFVAHEENPGFILAMWEGYNSQTNEIICVFLCSEERGNGKRETFIFALIYGIVKEDKLTARNFADLPYLSTGTSSFNLTEVAELPPLDVFKAIKSKRNI